MNILGSIQDLWNKVKSNSIFVAFEGGATGAALSFIDDGLSSGHIDFSKEGLHKLAIITLAGGITAVRLLKRPPYPASAETTVTIGTSESSGKVMVESVKTEAVPTTTTPSPDSGKKKKE